MLLQLHLHSRLNWLQWIGNDNCKTPRDAFTFWDLVWLILEVRWYYFLHWIFQCISEMPSCLCLVMLCSVFRCDLWVYSQPHILQCNIQLSKPDKNGSTNYMNLSSGVGKAKLKQSRSKYRSILLRSFVPVHCPTHWLSNIYVRVYLHICFYNVLLPWPFWIKILPAGLWPSDLQTLWNSGECFSINWPIVCVSWVIYAIVCLIYMEIWIVWIIYCDWLSLTIETLWKAIFLCQIGP